MRCLRLPDWRPASLSRFSTHLLSQIATGVSYRDCLFFTSTCLPALHTWRCLLASRQHIRYIARLVYVFTRRLPFKTRFKTNWDGRLDRQPVTAPRTHLPEKHFNRATHHRTTAPATLITPHTPHARTLSALPHIFAPHTARRAVLCHFRLRAYSPSYTTRICASSTALTPAFCAHASHSNPAPDVSTFIQLNVAPLCGLEQWTVCMVLNSIRPAWCDVRAYLA